MAIPKCPKCDNTTFQSTVNAPQKSNFKIQLIHCSSCGCVVGTQEYYNVGALVYALAKAMKIKIPE
jgi:hypothetical protein